MKQNLLNNLEWFENSGVMLPANGLWGVAERVAITKDNAALERMMNAFPAWTLHDEHCIIEQRRADCNFQSAYMYLLSYRLFGDRKYYEIAVNLLDFLYFKSGLLWRREDRYVPGSWNWSHIKRESVVWFDDESWCIFLALEIAAKFPELEKRYEMRRFAMMLAPHLAGAMKSAMAPGAEILQDKEKHWRSDTFIGAADQPHWGSLACMALARAYREDPRAEFMEVLEDYHAYLTAHADKFDVSEVCYAIMGACSAFAATDRDEFRTAAELFGQKLLSRMGENGNIPSEHDEAPCGPHLVDTIYTINWALLGLLGLKSFAPRYAEAFDKALKLVCSIQDDSPEKHLKGCWRGMYDMEKGCWGGGDLFEGGANSIYTGWTNAPISIVIALELLKENLFS
jgi:hypothetical protein